MAFDRPGKSYSPESMKGKKHLLPQVLFLWGGRWDSNPRMPEPQSGALGLLATPTIFCCADQSEGTRTKKWHARRDSFNQGVARSSPREQCSSALHLNVRVRRNPDKKSGTPEGTRTPDLLLRRQLLYPAELLAHLNGAGDGNRTRVSSLEGWCSTIELHPQTRETWLFSQSILAH